MGSLQPYWPGTEAGGGRAVCGCRPSALLGQESFRKISLAAAQKDWQMEETKRVFYRRPKIVLANSHTILTWGNKKGR